ncbi:ANR family transcriptional regulator [Serratia marcescens]|uniref:ANR family transcriptional regulator n=2 Tax=Serratia marcescens TaxID=615 RepID=UPI0011AF24E7
MSAILDGTCLDMSTELTPQARLRAIMQQAAQLERGGLFDDAALYWQRGAELSVLTNEHRWCEARALLCRKRCLRGDDVYLR